MKGRLKNHFWSLLLGVCIVLYLIPATGMPIKVFIQKVFAFSPSTVAVENQEILDDYHWKLKDLNQTEVSFSSSEGKVIVVNFWATWCPPCVAEMPSLQRLYEAYGNQVDFYFVTAEAPETITQFMQSKTYSIPVFIEGSQPPALLQSRQLPTTFLIAKDGRIIIKKKGVAKWDSASVTETIDQLLLE